MPALTCRRDRHFPRECWRIYYGDVHAGTIAECVGNPGAAPKWQWRCGFYPESRPGECTNGTAGTFEEARAAFEAAWVPGEAHQHGLPSLARSASMDRGEVSRTTELLRAEILGAVPGNQDTLAKPCEGLAQRRRGEQLLHALEAGLQQRRIGAIEHVADVIVRGDSSDPEPGLAVRAPLSLLQGTLERQK